MKPTDALRIANENQLAANFLVTFSTFCHLLDDIEDKDKPMDDVRLVQDSLIFMENLMLNPWVREHAAVLWPHMVTSWNAWLDSNRWQKSGDREKMRDADVVKGLYHEVAYLVAYLCGGWLHMRNITAELRAYDHDYKERKN